MCGIAGILGPDRTGADREGQLRQMLAMIRHRGPDQFGIYCDPHVGLGSARLSIIDLSSGQQPIANEDGTLWIVFNGEIFNYPELRRELEARGHRFSTQTDTEVLLHLYEDLGAGCLDRLNGQFAIAIWDAGERTLFLARDRLGIRPLYYAGDGHRLVFASEIKALLCDAEVRAEIDPVTLAQTFAYWSPLAPRTIFRGIRQLPPGHCLTVRDGELAIQRYWEVDFPDDDRRALRRLDEAVEAFHDLLVDATRIRLRADVPVGAYLSGGLDSSTIASVVLHHSSSRLETFSIAFDDADFDESAYQLEMARHLGTQHHVVRATHADIGQVFPEVAWHTEVPVMRTSPAPMFLLSKLVHDHGYKVVLTGEGADEFLAGYDIFKETRVRRFWAREPQSTRRPKLLQRLYQDIPGFAEGSGAFVAAFFREQLTEVDNPWYSHLIRWRNNRRTFRFLSHAVVEEASRAANDLNEFIPLPARFGRWGPIERAQYLEIGVFLSNYLLSSQGDRVAMAHSVEGRFPFLDFRVVDFCSRLPTNLKLRGLTEKFLLKECARRWLPEAIRQRPKRPYRAPIHRCFLGPNAPDYVSELCSAGRLRESGLFNAEAVGRLFQAARSGRALGETDDMAVAGIISTQLVHSQFVSGFRRARPLADGDDLRVCGPSAPPTKLTS